MMRYIGRSIPRLEDFRLLTGQGQFTDDMRWPGALHCTFVRSPHAHARIRAIDAGPALAGPGVAGVLTGADYVAQGLAGIRHMPNPADALDVKQRAFVGANAASPLDLAQWPLAVDRVRYVGEPLAAVLAESAAAAADAVEQILVDYETLPAAIAPADALRPDAPQLWDEAPGNLCFVCEFGNRDGVEQALQRANLVVEHEIWNRRIANGQMEPRAALCSYDTASDTYTVISGSQGVTKVQMTLAAAFGVPAERVRVICPDVGGGFGARTNVYPEQVVVAWAARRFARPVRWTSTRNEAFLADYQGRDVIMRARLGFDAEGRILAYAADILGNIGAHTVAYVTLANVQRMLTTAYHVPVAHAVVRGVLTNTVPTAPYRGAGRPEAHHMMERLLDIAARRLPMDRVTLRRRNLVARDTLPYRSAMNLVYDAVDFSDYLERALDAAGWRDFDQRKALARSRGRYAGIGLALHIAAPVGAPVERVRITVKASGTIDIIAGTQSTGQGHETVFAQVGADQFGVGIEAIRLRTGDSAFVRMGGGTHSDRSLRIVGTLILETAAKIIAQAREPAAALLQASPEELRFENGAYVVPASGRAVSLFEVAGALERQDLPSGLSDALSAESDFFGRLPAHPAGACVCELELEPETGAVEVTRYVSVNDVGQAINPLIVAGQIHGAVAQGIGQALAERVAVDPASGQVLTGSFMDYALLRADDLPNIDAIRVEHPTAGNPLRVKGSGEGGILGASPAVLNALCDALADAGIEDLPMPATACALWQALRAARSPPKP
jgi:carbon-monoxide dehydrogenase large subunit